MKMKLKKEMVCSNCDTSFKVSDYDIVFEAKSRKKLKVYLGIKKPMTHFYVKCPKCKKMIRICEEDLQLQMIYYSYEHKGNSHFVEDFFEHCLS